MAFSSPMFDQADHDALAVALASEDRRAWFNLADAERSLYSMRAIRLLSAVSEGRSHRQAGR